MAQFTKGHRKVGGRAKNVPNVSTRQARDILNQILYSELSFIKASLNDVREDDPGRYLEIMAKLLQYSLPRRTDLTTDDDRLTPGLTIVAMNEKEQAEIQAALDKIDAG